MKEKLPVQIGHNLRKGMLAYRNIKNGGFTVMIVWLKKDYSSGAEYDLEDIDKIDTVLHFCDKESMESMVKLLTKILKDWRGK